jgi:DNA-binding NtrC family response regulator
MDHFPAGAIRDTGTGKELLAREVARQLRPTRPFAPLNVAAIPAGVFDSQLFGHAVGAYSGAGAASPGVVMAHNGGTIFLDEIGELPPDLQPKLLRLLENREVWPVGATRPVRADVLVVAATNRSLEAMVAEGRFRRDLQARLEQAKLSLPSLAARREDIFAIVQAWCATKGTPLAEPEIEVDAVSTLLLHDWERNVRELQAKLDQIAATDRPGLLHTWAVQSVLGAGTAPVPVTMEQARLAVERTGGNETRAAADLGISRGKLRRLLAR